MRSRYSQICAKCDQRRVYKRYIILLSFALKAARKALFQTRLFSAMLCSASKTQNTENVRKTWLKTAKCQNVASRPLSRTSQILLKIFLNCSNCQSAVYAPGGPKRDTLFNCVKLQCHTNCKTADIYTV